MEITKRRQFFQLLGLLALVLVSGVMLTGCDASLLILFGGLVFGGIIGNAGGHVFIGIIVGGIIGFIAVCVYIAIFPDSSSSSYGSSSGSSYSAMSDWRKSRENDPHTCGNCGKYSGARGECRKSGASKSADDSCSSWE